MNLEYELNKINKYLSHKRYIWIEIGEIRLSFVRIFHFRKYIFKERKLTSFCFHS